jgi:addiction module RelE/StbE family toxin
LTVSAKDDFYATLESVSENPLSGKPLHGNLSGFYGIRFGGNYRIVYKVIPQNENTIVRIFEIGDRKDIYERSGRYFMI